MTGTMFQYEVRVREVFYLKDREQHSGSWRSFSTIRQAIEYCAENSPYKGKSGTYLIDWIIEVTLQSVVLEMLSPADWKALKKPTWKHPKGAE